MKKSTAYHTGTHRRYPCLTDSGGKRWFTKKTADQIAKDTASERRRLVYNSKFETYEYYDCGRPEGCRTLYPGKHSPETGQMLFPIGYNWKKWRK